MLEIQTPHVLSMVVNLIFDIGPSSSNNSSLSFPDEIFVFCLNTTWDFPVAMLFFSVLHHDSCKMFKTEPFCIPMTKYENGKITKGARYFLFIKSAPECSIFQFSYFLTRIQNMLKPECSVNGQCNCIKIMWNILQHQSPLTRNQLVQLLYKMAWSMPLKVIAVSIHQLDPKGIRLTEHPLKNFWLKLI